MVPLIDYYDDYYGGRPVSPSWAGFNISRTLTYAEDPTFIGHETGNEMWRLKFGDKDVLVAWTQVTCEYIKEFGPKKLCMDGDLRYKYHSIQYPHNFVTGYEGQYTFV